jgi:integrase
LDPYEARQLLHAVQGHRLEAFFTVALAIVLRPGEALGLQWQDVDLEEGTLSVHRAWQRINGRLQVEEVKSATSRRHITLPQVALEVLKGHRLRQGE